MYSTIESYGAILTLSLFKLSQSTRPLCALRQLYQARGGGDIFILFICEKPNFAVKVGAVAEAERCMFPEAWFRHH